MITLITGVPGSGKTLYTVSWLEKELASGRRLVVNGVKGLVLDHEMVDDDWVRDWHNRCQAQDIIVVDEVQRIWPPVNVGAKATPDVEALHVHRHKGVDIVVITQHPNRMNKVVRDLVGRHVHVRRLLGLNRAMLYEWDFAQNPRQLKDAVKTMWAYPKHVFNLYVSADAHTKPKAVVPKVLFLIPVAAAVVAVCGYLGYRGLTGGESAKKTDAVASAEVKGAPSSGGKGPVSAEGPKAVPSADWHVSGRYAVDGRAFVVLADAHGRFRVEDASGFKGDSLRTEGVVDGDRVAVWSGAGERAVAVGGGKK